MPNINRPTSHPAAPRKRAARTTIRTAKRGLSRRLFEMGEVSGVGIEETDEGREQIKVYLSEDTPQVRALVPETVDGYPVVVEVIGSILARGKSK